MIEIIIYGAVLGGLWMLIASGFTIVYGVAGIVNMAHGVFYALAAYMLYTVTIALHLPPSAGLILSMLIVLIMGMGIYRLLIQPIQHLHGLTILVTFVLTIVFVELFRLIYGPQPIHVASLMTGSVLIFSIPIMTQRLLILPVSVVALSCLWLFLKKTNQGKALRAVAQDREAATLMGINVQRMFSLAMGISILLAALAGGLVAPLETANPHTPWSPIMPMFAVAILGGLGSMEGAILAAFIMGYAEIAVAFTFGSQFRGIAPLLMILLVLEIRPQGLFGKRIRT